MRKTNQAGIELIKSFESLRLERYLDAAGLPTIGYGHLIKRGESFTKITRAEADEILRADLDDTEKAVERAVHVTLTDNEFAALVSLTFNIGGAAFSRSTLLKRLNEGNLLAAGERFKDWNKAGGRILRGLVRRRAAEKALFFDNGEKESVAQADDVEPPAPTPEPTTPNNAPVGAEGSTTTVNVAEAGAVIASPQPVIVPGGGANDPAIKANKDSLPKKFLKWIGGIFGGLTVAGSVTSATQIGQTAATFSPGAQEQLIGLLIFIAKLGLLLGSVVAIIGVVAMVRDHEKTREDRADPSRVNTK